MSFYSEQFSGMEFNSIRVVHTNIICQDNESGWCEISVYDASTDTLIASGRDIVEFKGASFYMEAKKNIEGFICYGATFKMPDAMYHNALEITVLRK